MIALVAAAALAAASAGPQTSAQTLDSLERMYQQSCSVKAYGSYDDICNGLRKQMKEAQKRQKKEAQAQAKTEAAPRAQAASAPTGPTLGLAAAKD